MARSFSEELLRFAEESSAAAIATDMDFNVAAANEEFLSLSGYARKELSGLSAAGLIEGGGRELEKIIETGYAFNLNISFLGKEGARIPALVQAVVLRDGGGSPAGIAILAERISGRGGGEGSAELSNEFLRVIRNIGNTAGKTADRGKILDRICENLVRMSGYNSVWAALTDPEDGSVFMTAEYGLGILPFADELKRGELCYCMKRAMAQSSVLVIDDPQTACGGCPIATIFGKTSAMTARIEYAGRIYGVINAHADKEIVSDRGEQDVFSEIALNIASILHRIEAEEQRVKADIETKKARRMKSDFLALISHRFRTPLTPVKEGVNIILEGLAGEVNSEQKEILGAVARSADALMDLVEKVVELEKLRNGMVRPEYRLHDAVKMLEELKEKATKDIMLKKLEFRIVSPEKTFNVLMDREMIKEALRILLSNAVKHTDKGSVTADVREEGGKAVFTVTDTGCGIAEENIDSIFDRFGTSAGPAGDSKGGAGLGLSICSGIAGLHGGGISVRSKPGEGSSFRLEIPLEKPARGRATGRD